MRAGGNRQYAYMGLLLRYWGGLDPVGGVGGVVMVHEGRSVDTRECGRSSESSKKHNVVLCVLL